MARRGLTALSGAVLAVALAVAAPSSAQPLSDEGSFQINLRDTDLGILAEQVSEITGRTLVFDPSLQGEVTVISAQPLTQAGVWSLFQSILRVRGFVAVESGVIWEIVPEAEALSNGATLRGDERAGAQDVVTQVVLLDRLPASEAVRVLRPLVADEGYIEALEDPNAIIVTDTQANVDRIREIAQTFDWPEDLRTEVIRFSFAQAANVAQAMGEVLGSSGTGARISVDSGSNVLLVRGSAGDIAQIRDLARDLDVAPRANPQAQVRTHFYQLRFGDAEAIAEIVAATLQGADLSNPVAEDVAESAPAPDAPVPEISVQASTEANAIVVRGTARQIEEAVHLIRALDTQRKQVMIEAAIVEVSGEVADRLGVQFGIGDNLPNEGIAATSFGNAGTPLSGVLAALGVSQASGLASGLTVGGATDNFGLILQALSQSTSARLLSTPSITTTDNSAATIVVGQNVPFRTGSFATDGNTLTPFTTIERRDVGITMEVLPRVTADGIVRLDISQEVSALVNANVSGAADLITNRRVIDTTVQARDRGIVVLGGLITDDEQAIDGKVPGLGDLPVLGELFRSRSRSQTRRTLFVFMRPTVIDGTRSGEAIANRQFQRLRDADASEAPRSLLRERPVNRLPLEINGLY